MILITGATGDIGHQLCKLLTKEKLSFRAMCRKREQIDQFSQEGIEGVFGDFDDSASLRAAMQGCDRLFLVTPPTQKQVQREKRAIDAAREAGITYVVKVSASDANLGSTVPWAKSHAEIDHYLRGSGLEWTILKPTAFQQNFLSLAKPITKGFLPQVADNGVVGYIHTGDIARVAFRVLLEDDHKHATYFLTGPEVLTMRDVASRLSDTLGKKVRYVNLPSPVFRLMLRISGLSSWFASGLIEQFSEVVARAHAMDLNHEVERLTGCAPRSLADFFQENQEKFSTGHS